MKDNQAKYPKLRFKGFTYPWEKRKLGDMVLISKDKNTDNQFGKNEVVSVSREAGTVNQIEYHGRSFAANDVSSYKKIKLGDLVYTKSPLKGAPYGIFQYTTIVGIVSPLYAVYHSTKKSFAPFVALQLRDDNIASHYLSRIVTKGAKNTINVTDTDVLDGYLNFPNRIEQQKIFDFFQKLDNLITVNQRKLAKLKELKQGYLQKLFPENGSKFPQLRFSGFADDWEERKLKDVLDISKTKNKAQQYGKVDVLSVSREVGTVNQIKYQGRSFAGSDLSNYKVVQGGELIYTKSPLKGAPYGIFQVATIKGILSPLYAVYTSTDKAYTPFIAMALKNDNIATHYLTPLVTKGAKNTINVTDEGALEGKIQFPSILEQKQIFIFFKQLDDTIALHQRKLEKLQELKKGYLQKMFC
ncbi:restriction endonuclease subunit S [Lacticaseibacillus casei]|uniref:restriction endonuclease subunit S n=1 Tax=Lacticaseibacillus casei TaxID=1582 RepID=UPI001109F1DA|nr:restriction endonuclease subunit S [Lacticaseibacillus casei]TLQ49028.1 restriction endonuclease subunit S [Lacticaseibacillus casei]